MLIVNNDARPEETIYYTACCALNILRERTEATLDELYKSVMERYVNNLDYSTLVLSVNLLFLIDKVENKKEKIRCI